MEGIGAKVTVERFWVAPRFLYQERPHLLNVPVEAAAGAALRVPDLLDDRSQNGQRFSPLPGRNQNADGRPYAGCCILRVHCN